jgi:hypothetical protein
MVLAGLSLKVARVSQSPQMVVKELGQIQTTSRIELSRFKLEEQNIFDRSYEWQRSECASAASRADAELSM